MNTETKRLPGIPDRTLEHIAAKSGARIVRDEELGTVAWEIPGGSKIAAKNNTALLIKLLGQNG